MLEILDNVPGFKDACKVVSELLPSVKLIRFDLSSIEEAADKIGSCIEDRMKQIGDLQQVVRGEISLSDFLVKQISSDGSLSEVENIKETFETRYADALKTVDLLKSVNKFGELFGGK